MKSLAVILFLFCSISSYSQKEPFKFGKIEVEDIDMDSCDFYPEAHAMILGEYGYLNFIFSDHESSFKYQLKIIVRKKIFNKTEKDVGSFKIPYYEPETGSSREEISGLKGYTYNLVDGKVEKTKLGKEGIFENRINDLYKELAITMPDVREGSVIEYTYTLTSDFLSTLTTWHFQSDIPVKYSELRMVLPEFYNYQLNNVGAYVSLEQEESIKMEDFKYSYKVDNGNGGYATQFSNIPSKSRYRRLIARNVPPVLDEPFMNNKVDIPNRIEFQLISIHMPQSPVKPYADSYENFTKNLMERSDFGLRLSKGNFAKDIISTLPADDQVTLAAGIYAALQKHFSWNEKWGLASEKAGRPAFNESTGSVSDINLSLVAAFKEAGLEAHPIILSTRGNGIPHPIYPSYNDFNYVVAMVKANDNYYFADATTKYPLGMLPFRCLNGQGWVVAEGGGHWVNLKQNSLFNTTTMVTTTIEPGKMINKIQMNRKGYAAINTAEEISRSGKEKYQETVAGEFPEWELNEFTVDKIDLSEGVSIEYNLTKESGDEDIIYLQPLLVGMETKNPYVREERYSPIDYPYSYHKRTINVITFPEGYKAEVPESSVIALPDGAGRFIYNVALLGQKISITSELRLNRTDFAPNEYAYLKQFYQIMAEKNSSLIVLKKI